MCTFLIGCFHNKDVFANGSALLNVKIERKR